MVYWATHCGITIAASVLFAVAIEITFPLNTLITDSLGLDTYGLLFFLPHGIRVLTAYLFGWRSVAYLLPAIAIYANSDASTGDYILSVILGLSAQISCVLAFYALGAIKAIEQNFLDVPIRSDSLILAALAGAAFNASAHYIIYDGTVKTASSILIGDVLGFIAVLVTALFLFRGVRKLR